MTDKSSPLRDTWRRSTWRCRVRAYAAARARRVRNTDNSIKHSRNPRGIFTPLFFFSFFFFCFFSFFFFFFASLLSFSQMHIVGATNPPWVPVDPARLQSAFSRLRVFTQRSTDNRAISGYSRGRSFC